MMLSPRSALTWSAALASMAALAIGVTLTLHGLSQLDWPTCFTLTRSGYGRLLLTVALCGGSVWVLARIAGWRAWAGAALASLLIAAFGGALWSLLWVAAVGLSMVLVGDLLLRRLSWLPGDRSAHLLVSLALGAVAYGASIELVASLPVHGPLTYSLAVLVPILMCRSRLLELAGTIRAVGRHSSTRVRALDCVLAALGVVYVITSLFPELGYDAMVFHLAVPYDMAHHGQWHFDVTRMALAMMPKHADWLYSVGFMHGGETGARMMNAGLILASAYAIYWLTSKFSVAHAHTFGLVASGLFLSMPLTFAEGSILFVESVWTFFVLATLTVRFADADDEAAPGAAIAALALMCGAVATKPQGLLSSAVLAAILAPWMLRCLRQLRVRHLPWIFGLIALVAAAPYVRAWLVTGNPVFPFFNGIFKSDLFAHVNFKDAWQAPVDWTLPYALTFESGRFMEGFPGSAGFQWLLLLPAAAVAVSVRRNRPALIMMMAGLALFAAVFIGSKYLRYVFPALATLMPVIGIGISALGPLLMRIATGLAVACIALNCGFLTAAGLKYSDFPVGIIGDATARDAYVQARLPIRSAIEAINALDGDSRPVAFFCQPAGAGLRGKPLYASWYNGTFDTAVRDARSVDDIGRLLCGSGVGYLIMDARWGTADQRAMVEGVSDLVAQLGAAQVRRVREELCLSDEVLRSPSFSDPSVWSTASTLETCSPSGGIVVSQPNPATQLIEARPGSRYVMSVAATGIDAATPCRAQVNWLDTQGRIVRSDIEVFEASTSMTRHVMRRRAPESSTSALVYATSHDSRPVCLREISLKWLDSGQGGKSRVTEPALP